MEEKQEDLKGGEGRVTLRRKQKTAVFEQTDTDAETGLKILEYSVSAILKLNTRK